MEAQATDIHKELIERCLRGDRKAYYKLYTLYSKSMYNVSYRIVNERDDAEDVLQESFISAFRNLKNYRGDATFGAWIKRIVINKAINHVKRRKMVPLNEQMDIEEELEETSFDEFPFSIEQVRSAIEKLPDGYRTVLSLYLIEGYDHQEIGEIMSISESTSKSQFNRSKKKLREILEGGKL
ncbi:MAG: RNA polymerase sigma factor [Flammeovirgaceae bacterium]|nr:RNA polymerase sigma factor [Flammeovirgaceae bacterium]